jgi:prepilin-type N-terminal cleavage/methylation domain-containing protein
MQTDRPGTEGFTLIELLLVLGIMAILAGIIFLALNPSRQLGLARNRQRHNDITSIMDALYQYQIDEQQLPDGIPGDTALGICKDGAASCVHGVDLSVLSLSGTYLVAIPADPQIAATATGTNYFIVRDSDRRLTLTAPGAEGGEAITVRR